jgi:hypothetical protein
MRLGPAHQVDRFIAISCLADDFELLVSFEEFSESGSD